MSAGESGGANADASNELHVRSSAVVDSPGVVGSAGVTSAAGSSARPEWSARPVQLAVGGVVGASGVFGSVGVVGSSAVVGSTAVALSVGVVGSAGILAGLANVGCAGCVGCIGCVNCRGCVGCVGCIGCVGLTGAVGRMGRTCLTVRRHRRCCVEAQAAVSLPGDSSSAPARAPPDDASVEMHARSSSRTRCDVVSSPVGERSPGRADGAPAPPPYAGSTPESRARALRACGARGCEVGQMRCGRPLRFLFAVPPLTSGAKAASRWK